jgi:hypothetical protein
VGVPTEKSVLVATVEVAAARGAYERLLAEILRLGRVVHHSRRENRSLAIMATDQFVSGLSGPAPGFTSSATVIVGIRILSRAGTQTLHQLAQKRYRRASAVFGLELG